jgi:CNT family concentrative nucleoside transporter
MSYRLISLLGIFGLIGLSWLASNNRKYIKWRIVFWGLTIQLLFGILVLKTSAGRVAFEGASDGVYKLISFADKGTDFVFGPLHRADPHKEVIGDDYHPQVWNPKTGQHEPMGFILLIHALIPIIFFASLMSVLYHLGIMTRIMGFMAKGMHRLMGTSGSETLSATANIFVGQTEAPLVVKPFINSMTLSEIHAVMAGGFATVAGGVLAAYVGFGIDPGHLLAASVMSAPAALVAAKMFFPETEESVTAGEVKVELEQTSVNVLDAACQGASDGMKLVLNVAAMLIAFIALVALVDWMLISLDVLVMEKLLGVEAIGLSLSAIFGKLFFPIAALIGVEWGDCDTFGSLMGYRMATNEFYAYMELYNTTDISPRTHVLATYAFCGFANFASIAIQIGGIGAVAPKRAKDLARVGMRAMFAGTMASLFTAALVGALLSPGEIESQYKNKQFKLNTGVHQPQSISEKESKVVPLRSPPAVESTSPQIREIVQGRPGKLPSSLYPVKEADYIVDSRRNPPGSE